MAYHVSFTRVAQSNIAQAPITPRHQAPTNHCESNSAWRPIGSGLHHCRTRCENCSLCDTRKQRRDESPYAHFNIPHSDHMKSPPELNHPTLAAAVSNTKPRHTYHGMEAGSAPCYPSIPPTTTHIPDIPQPPLHPEQPTQRTAP